MACVSDGQDKRDQGGRDESQVAATAQSALIPQAGPVSQGLQILLRADKKSYLKGQTINASITFANVGEKPFRIYLNRTFQAAINVYNQAGESFPSEDIRIFSPKHGVYVGKTKLIEPKRSFVEEVTFRISDKYELMFEGKRIHNLTQPGEYHFRVVHYTREMDRSYHLAGAETPEEGSLEHLWIGEATSNVVKLQLK